MRYYLGLMVLYKQLNIDVMSHIAYRGTIRALEKMIKTEYSRINGGEKT